MTLNLNEFTKDGAILSFLYTVATDSYRLPSCSCLGVSSGRYLYTILINARTPQLFESLSLTNVLLYWTLLLPQLLRHAPLLSSTILAIFIPAL